MILISVIKLLWSMLSKIGIKIRKIKTNSKLYILNSKLTQNSLRTPKRSEGGKPKVQNL